MKSKALLALLHIADPTLPIGGFTHSAGLETYVHNGIVTNAASAKEFIMQMLVENIQYNDASFLSLAFDAVNDYDKLLSLDQECTALKIPRETREASRKLGLRLFRIFSGQFSHSYIDAVEQKVSDGNYAVVFGFFTAMMKVEKQEALTALLYNATVAMVTNAVKLVPLGQMEGQKILFELYSLLDQLVQNTLQPDLELLGKSCPGFDLRCMQHETLYTRLYIS
jgi:urease accessory protein